ncbi:MAG: hypothetical protein WAV41_01090 [Microgenomates group bacterium]
MSKKSTASLEIELPQDTITAIKAYASEKHLSFNKATLRFISIGQQFEQLASESGVTFHTKLPASRHPHPFGRKFP